MSNRITRSKSKNKGTQRHFEDFVSTEYFVYASEHEEEDLPSPGNPPKCSNEYPCPLGCGSTITGKDSDSLIVGMRRHISKGCTHPQHNNPDFLKNHEGYVHFWANLGAYMCPGCSGGFKSGKMSRHSGHCKGNVPKDAEGIFAQTHLNQILMGLSSSSTSNQSTINNNNNNNSNTNNNTSPQSILKAENRLQSTSSGNKNSSTILNSRNSQPSSSSSTSNQSTINNNNNNNSNNNNNKSPRTSSRTKNRLQSSSCENQDLSTILNSRNSQPSSSSTSSNQSINNNNNNNLSNNNNLRYQNLANDPLEGCEEEKSNFTSSHQGNTLPPPPSRVHSTSSSIRTDNNNRRGLGNNNNNQNSNNNVINSSSLIISDQNSSSSTSTSIQPPPPPPQAPPPPPPDDAVDYLQLANIIPSYRNGLISNVPTIPYMSNSMKATFQKTFAKVGGDFSRNPHDPKCYLPFILLPLGCLRHGLGGKVRMQRMAMLLEGKVSEFLISLSYDPALDTTCSNHQAYDEEKTIMRALNMVTDGNLSKGNNILFDGTVSTLTPDKVELIKAKHPEEPQPLPQIPDNKRVALNIRKENMNSTLLGRKPKTASGQNGYSFDQLKGAIKENQDIHGVECLTVMTKIINLIHSSEQFPPQVESFFTDGRLFAKDKGNGGVRPIAISDSFMRLAGSTALNVTKENIKNYLEPTQLAVGSQSGTETIIHQTRQLMKDGHFILQIDLTNAFNSVSRCAIQEELIKHAPSLLNYWDRLYGSHTNLSLKAEDGIHGVPSQTGVRQGCPFGTAFFCIAIQRILNEIDDPDILKLAYADDLIFASKHLDKLQQLGKHLQKKFKEIGLEINTEKSFLMPPSSSFNSIKDINQFAGAEGHLQFSVDLSGRDPKFVNQFQTSSSSSSTAVRLNLAQLCYYEIEPSFEERKQVISQFFDFCPITFNGLKILGTPVGSSDFMKSFLDSFIDTFVSRKEELERILRGSYGKHGVPSKPIWDLFCSSLCASYGHLLRTMPPSDPIQRLFKELKSTIEDFFISFLGIEDEHDPVLRRMFFKKSDGGEGILDPVVYHPVAYVASLLELHQRRTIIPKQFLGQLIKSVSEKFGLKPLLPTYQELIELNGQKVQHWMMSKSVWIRRDFLEKNPLQKPSTLATSGKSISHLSTSHNMPSLEFLTHLALKYDTPLPFKNNQTKDCCNGGGNDNKYTVHHLLSCNVNGNVQLRHNHAQYIIFNQLKSAGIPVIREPTSSSERTRDGKKLVAKRTDIKFKSSIWNKYIHLDVTFKTILDDPPARSEVAHLNDSDSHKISHHQAWVKKEGGLFFPISIDSRGRLSELGMKALILVSEEVGKFRNIPSWKILQWMKMELALQLAEDNARTFISRFRTQA